MTSKWKLVAALCLTVALAFPGLATVPAGAAGDGVVNKYAVIVANWNDGTPAGEDYGLVGPGIDKDTVHNYLFDHGFYSVVNGNKVDDRITMLLCGGATHNTISSALKAVAQKCDADDEFVFYYSGHGDWLGKSEIVLFNNQYFTESDFNNALANLKSKKSLFVFDCCQAGGFAALNPLGTSSMRLFGGIAKDGWVVVSASSLTFSYDSDNGGVFTNTYWRDGLANGRANNNMFARLIGGTGTDTRVSVEEAYYYSRFSSLNILNQAAGPMMDDQYEGEFFI